MQSSLSGAAGAISLRLVDSWSAGLVVEAEAPANEALLVEGGDDVDVPSARPVLCRRSVSGRRSSVGSGRTSSLLGELV